MHKTCSTCTRWTPPRDVGGGRFGTCDAASDWTNDPHAPAIEAVDSEVSDDTNSNPTVRTTAAFSCILHEER